MSIVVYPVHIRKSVLRFHSDGWSLRKNAAHHGGMCTATIRGWAKLAGIIPGGKISEEEMDAKFEKWAEKMRRMEHATEVSHAKKSRKAQLDDKKFGRAKSPQDPNRKNSLATFKDLNPDEMQEALQENVERMVGELDRATSMEDQVTALTAGLLLAQTKTLIDNPPPILTWADAERVVKLLRLTLGMDRDKGNATEGIDLRIVNAKVGTTPKGRKKTFIEAEDV